MYTVNYVAAFYIGPNRPTPYIKAFEKDPMHFVRIHKEFLDTCEGTHITGATFMFNNDIGIDLMGRISYYLLQCKIPIKVIFRPNGGYSYGAWNDAIKDSVNDFDYFFMIEDDYIPDATDFYKPFVERITDDTPYVCGYVGVDMGVVHAAHSNGIITGSACKKVLENNTDLFVFVQTDRLQDGWESQRNFLSKFTNIGYKITDITDRYLTRHMMDCYTNRVVEFGVRDGRCLIQPIVVRG
jgi:hypothetical protein